MIKSSLIACAAALLVAGCSTTHTHYDAQGRPLTHTHYDAMGHPYIETETYYGGAYHGSTVDGLNRGINTNWFGPVDGDINAAWGVGTPSGTFDHRR